MKKILSILLALALMLGAAGGRCTKAPSLRELSAEG